MNSVVQGKKSVWAWAVATVLGAGFLKPGPGTWGAAAAALLWWGAGGALHPTEAQFSWYTLAAVVVTIAVGVPAATRVAQESGREDPGHIVIDEVAGQWVALIHSPIDLSHLLAAFLLFRIFDIVKPWPARQLERCPGGWGIVLDDLAAGVYALLVMQILQHWIG